MLPTKNTEGLPWGYSWLRLCAPKGGGPGLIPGQGTEIPHAGVAKLKKKKKRILKWSLVPVSYYLCGQVSFNDFIYVFFCCCSVIKSCLTLCNPMDCSAPGLPVPYYLPEFAQAHVH